MFEKPLCFEAFSRKLDKKKKLHENEGRFLTATVLFFITTNLTLLIYDLTHTILAIVFPWHKQYLFYILTISATKHYIL